MNADKALEALATQRVSYASALGILRFTNLNPEQKLAYVLEQMVSQQKGTLALLEIANIVAKETVAWKDTPEGVAWRAKKQAEREKKAQDVTPG